MLAAVWVVGVLTSGAYLTMWLEARTRRASAPAGPAMPVDAVVETVPARTDPWLYHAAPVLALLAAVGAMVVIPFSRFLVGADLGAGLFYFLVVADFLVLAIATGGWGANGAEPVEACYRGVAQMVAYVVPLGLAVIGPAMMARSLSLVRIVEAQADAGLWYAAVQPLGFALYIITALIQTYRAPFLEPFSERIDGGVLSGYRGWRAAFWRLALSGILFVAAALGAALFLGGFRGPLLPGPVWMAGKALAVLLLMLWVSSRLRLRSTAELLALSWKILIPVGLLNVLVVGALILYGVGQPPFR